MSLRKGFSLSRFDSKDRMKLWTKETDQVTRGWAAGNLFFFRFLLTLLLTANSYLQVSQRLFQEIIRAWEDDFRCPSQSASWFLWIPFPRIMFVNLDYFFLRLSVLPSFLDWDVIVFQCLLTSRSSQNDQWEERMNFLTKMPFFRTKSSLIFCHVWRFNTFSFCNRDYFAFFASWCECQISWEDRRQFCLPVMMSFVYFYLFCSDICLSRCASLCCDCSRFRFLTSLPSQSFSFCVFVVVLKLFLVFLTERQNECKESRQFENVFLHDEDD